MARDGQIIIGVSGVATGYVGDDLNFKGPFATANGTGTAQTDLLLAFPVGVEGWYASVGSTDTIWKWDSDTTAWVDTNEAFVAGGMTQVIYDPTLVEGDVFDMDNMVEGTTNKILTDAERTKLTGISVGAEVNVNADWDAVVGDAEILNKPTIPTSTATLPDSSNKRYVTDAQLSDISGLTASLASKEAVANKATDLTSPDNTKYPTTLAVANAIGSGFTRFGLIEVTAGIENDIIFEVGGVATPLPDEEIVFVPFDNGLGIELISLTNIKAVVLPQITGNLHYVASVKS
jgi:hypothetical protein